MEVVENARPSDEKYEALVVEKAEPWLTARNAEADVVEKKNPLSYVARRVLAEVVEKAEPWLRERKKEADVVENALPWLSARNAEALVVEKKLLTVFQ